MQEEGAKNNQTGEGGEGERGREKTKKMAEGDESKDVSAGHPSGDPGGPLTASPGNCQYSQLPPLSRGRVSGQLVPPGPILLPHPVLEMTGKFIQGKEGNNGMPRGG